MLLKSVGFLRRTIREAGSRLPRPLIAKQTGNGYLEIIIGIKRITGKQPLLGVARGGLWKAIGVFRSSDLFPMLEIKWDFKIRMVGLIASKWAGSLGIITVLLWSYKSPEYRVTGSGIVFRIATPFRPQASAP
jgi:hypothetical protein